MTKRSEKSKSSIPPEFKRMVWLFNRDAIPEPFEEQQFIRNVLCQFDGTAKVVIGQYLDELLKRKLEGNELQRIWHVGHPAYIMSDEHLHIFLKMISKALKPS